VIVDGDLAPLAEAIEEMRLKVQGMFNGLGTVLGFVGQNQRLQEQMAAISKQVAYLYGGLRYHWNHTAGQHATLSSAEEYESCAK
jgi:hypothetical protein